MNSIISTTLVTAALITSSLTTKALKAENRDLCSNKPVVMVVDGVTNNAQQMAIYGQALRESGLHKNKGSYYLNNPRSLRILEGDRKQNHVTLLINFPSECAALNFWNSPIYQQKIRPLREGAGEYTIELYQLL